MVDQRHTLYSFKFQKYNDYDDLLELMSDILISTAVTDNDRKN